MARSKYDIGYIAAGAHELGHAKNLEDSRYPRARTAVTSFSRPVGQVISPVGGLLARAKLGPAGGALVGGGLGLVSNIPILIEEHQASKNALKALRDTGEYSDKEYKEAKGVLDSAYRTYITSALNDAATSGAIGSANIPIAAGLLGGAYLQTSRTKNKHIPRVSAALKRPNKEGNRRIDLLRRRMQLRAQILDSRNLRLDKSHQEGAFFAAPERHMPKPVRSGYKKSLETYMSKRDAQRVAADGAIFLPSKGK